MYEQRCCDGSGWTQRPARHIDSTFPSDLEEVPCACGTDPHDDPREPWEPTNADIDAMERELVACEAALAAGRAL